MENDSLKKYFINKNYLIASFLAIVLFSLNIIGYYNQPINSFRMVVLTFFHIIGTAWFPLCMISLGYLLIEKKLSYKYYYQLLYFLLNYLFFGFVLAIFNSIYSTQDFNAWENFIKICNYTISPYAWAIEIYIGMYLVIPLLNNMWRNSKGKQDHLLIVIVFFILCCLPSTLNVYEKIFPTYFLSIYPIFYYFLGAYYKTNIEQKNNKLFVKNGIYFLVLGSIISLVQNLTVLYDAKFEERIFNQYFSWSACLIAVGIFLLSKKYELNKKEKVVKTINYFGKFNYWLILGIPVLIQLTVKYLQIKDSKLQTMNPGILLIADILLFGVGLIVYSLIYGIYKLLVLIVNKIKS